MLHVDYEPSTSEALCSDGFDWRWRDGTGASRTRCEGVEDRAEALAGLDAWVVETTNADAGDWRGADCRWGLVGVEAG